MDAEQKSDMDPEAVLLARVRRGDEAALQELYERLSSKVYTIIMNLVRNHEEAEEVLQDTFYKLFRKADSYTTWNRSPRAFIYTIARNEATSRLRKRQARPKKADAFDMHDPALPMAAKSNATEPTTRVWLERALDGLDSEEREILENIYFKGYSHRDLAKVTGMPLGTLKTKVRRALGQLKDAMGDVNGGDEDGL